MFLAAVRRILAFSRKPWRPYFIKAAQVPAITDPALEPAIVGVTYMPPGHAEQAKNVSLLNSLFLNKMIEQPLGP